MFVVVVVVMFIEILKLYIQVQLLPFVVVVVVVCCCYLLRDTQVL